MTQAMKGRFWQLEYKSGTYNGPRVVFCFDEDGHLANCWDFTHDGFRNFTKSQISKIEQLPVYSSVSLPKGLTNVKEILDSYVKEGRYAWYNKDNGVLSVIKKPDNYCQSYRDSDVNIRINYDGTKDAIIWWEYPYWYIGKYTIVTPYVLTDVKRFKQLNEVFKF